MREYRFRAWVKNSGDMCYFGLGEDNIGYVSKHDGEYYHLELQHADAIMQFTGLRDRNGKEIYEGDILKHQYKGKGLVVYEAPGFRVVGDDMDVWLGHCDEHERKVIGNIHENPELLDK